MKQKNIIIITGASSGMGKEFVKQIDAHFPKVDELWLIARRKDELKKLASNCKHTVRVLAYDLCKESSIEVIQELLEWEKPKISLLVNSAGYGVLGAFYMDEKKDTNTIEKESNFTKGENAVGAAKRSWLQEQRGMVSLNCDALTAMTYLCIPYMKKGGRIIQLASSAAFLPQPKFAVYAATKSYVLSFSRALNEELRKEEISVTAVCPGPVDTAFFERAEKGTDTLFIKKLVMANPKKVVRKALQDAKSKKEVSIYSLPIQGFYLISKLLPHKLLLWIMRAMK